MDLFTEFSLSRELSIKDGEITLDAARLAILPISFVGNYLIKLKKDETQANNLYETVKKSFVIEDAIPLGKEYGLTYTDFLDRWVKYTAFGGWGNVKYQLIDKEKKIGLLHVLNLPLHLYLKNKGVLEPSDPLWEGLIAGSLSGTFKADVDVIETECICSGKDACVFYWGSKEDLKKKFPKLVANRLGD